MIYKNQRSESLNNQRKMFFDYRQQHEMIHLMLKYHISDQIRFKFDYTRSIDQQRATEGKSIKESIEFVFACLEISTAQQHRFNVTDRLMFRPNLSPKSALLAVVMVEEFKQQEKSENGISSI